MTFTTSNRPATPEQLERMRAIVDQIVMSETRLVLHPPKQHTRSALIFDDLNRSPEHKARVVAAYRTLSKAFHIPQRMAMDVPRPWLGARSTARHHRGVKQRRRKR